MRFIGSKARLLDFIGDVVRSEVHIPSDGRVGDLFCGTASVSRLFSSMGYQVVANDSLLFCCVFARAVLTVTEEPVFARLSEIHSIRDFRSEQLLPTSYDRVLAFLNDLPGKEGFIYKEYSLGGSAESDYQRMYFSDSNAQLIDGIRSQIADWCKNGLLSEPEECLLLSDLMRAANSVANIAGTYGCFLKRWDPRALKRMRLTRSPITTSTRSHEVTNMNANALVKHRRFDLLYLDPPYTWRHYGAYYHILETIAHGDEPTVSGRTGIRPWEDLKSKYCDRKGAEPALKDLVSSADCGHLFLSYNSEGLISHDQILDILGERGEPRVFEATYQRYKSNNGGVQQGKVKERLYYVQCC